MRGSRTTSRNVALLPLRAQTRASNYLLTLSRLFPGARLGLHVDRRSTRHAATPVVAISLGESAEFVWKRSWKKALPLERLLLRSGDILIFGGAARAMVHGVERLVAGSAPTALRLGADAGWRRLCITCREH